jgi:hypothetical protein
MPWKESSDGRACRGVCFAEIADIHSAIDTISMI